MEKFDLRELNKMVQSFRRCHRALLKLREGEDFEIAFTSHYRSDGIAIPVIDEEKTRAHLIGIFECEINKLRKKFADMGIDPLDAPRKKKAELKVAK